MKKKIKLFNYATNPTIAELSPTSIPKNNLKIAYLNVCGLTDVKLSALTSKLDDQTLLFISETWYIDHEKRKSNPLILASTPFYAKYSFRRQDHGMIIMASPILVETLAIKIVAITSYSIKIMIGDSLRLAGVYFPPSMTAKCMLDELDVLSDTSLLIGDFNIRLGSITEDIVSGPKDRLNLLSSFLGAYNMSILKPININNAKSRVDHIFVTKFLINHINPTSFIVDKAPIPTDHPLLSLNIHFNFNMNSSISKDSKPTIRYSISNLEKFPTISNQFCKNVEALSTSLEELIQSNNISLNVQSDELIEILDNALTDIIQTCLEETVGTYRPSRSSNPSSNISHTALSNQKAILIYKQFMKNNGYKKNTPIQTCDDKQIITLDKAYTYYSNFFGSSPNKSNPNTLTKKKKVNEFKEVPSNPKPILNSPFNTSLVKWAIENYPRNKSPGLDGIDNRILRHLLDVDPFINCLTTLYQQCYLTGNTPERWNLSVIYPIRKDNNKKTTSFNDLRPISLTMIFRRLFEKILLIELYNSNIAIDRGQAGFRSGFSCLTQILSSNETYFKGKQVKVFIDLKSAYDNVSIPILITKLQKKQLAIKMVEIIYSLFNNCKSTVAINGCLTNQFSLKHGLLQGSLLSPWLFNIFIDDLAADINEQYLEYPIPPCLLFADDIQLQAGTEAEMHNLLDLVGKWCMRNCMEINISKCGLLLPRHMKMITHFSVNSDPIPRVSSYKYLGLIFLENGNIDIIDHLSRKRKQAVAIIESLSKDISTKIWPECIKLNIYKIFVRSLFEYAAPLIIAYIETRNPGHKKILNKSIAELEGCQKEAIRWIFSTKKSYRILLSLSGLAPVSNRLNDLLTQFSCQLKNINNSSPLAQVIASNCISPMLQKIVSALPSPSVSINDVIKINNRKKIEHLSTICLLAKYIPRTARSKSGYEKCLTIPNPNLRNAAIRWRANHYGQNNSCAKCEVKFKRTHVTDCPTFSKEYLTLVGPLGLEQFKKQKEIYENFTILDHILNQGDYPLFEKLIKKLDQQLTKSVFS